MSWTLRAAAPALAVLIASPSACAINRDRISVPAEAEQKAPVVAIRIDVEGRSITATLEESETARDFASLLPLELTLTDYAETEKIGDLPRRLSTEGAPQGVTPAAGDLAYYAPWGNLAVFLRDFRHSSGLVRLGRLDDGLEVFRRPGPLQVTIWPAVPSTMHGKDAPLTRLK